LGPPETGVLFLCANYTIGIAEQTVGTRRTFALLDKNFIKKEVSCANHGEWLKFIATSQLESAMTEASPKRRKFVKLAESRTDYALYSIRKLGGLARRRFYEYSAEDVNIIFRALRETVDETERKFRADSDVNARFTL
jgi:hypothetical protein